MVLVAAAVARRQVLAGSEPGCELEMSPWLTKAVEVSPDSFATRNSGILERCPVWRLVIRCDCRLEIYMSLRRVNTWSYVDDSVGTFQWISSGPCHGGLHRIIRRHRQRKPLPFCRISFRFSPRNLRRCRSSECPSTTFLRKLQNVRRTQFVFLWMCTRSSCGRKQNWYRRNAHQKIGTRSW